MRRGATTFGILSLAIGALIVVPLNAGPASGTSPAAHGWRVSASYTPHYKQLSAVACPTTTDCYAVGVTSAGKGAVVATTDGGSTWVDQTVPAGVAALNKIACASPTTCYAVGAASPYHGVIIATTDSGATWNQQTTPSGVRPLNAIACPTVDECLSGGAMVNGYLATTDAGLTWTTRRNRGPGNLSAIACPSAADCDAVAGGDAIYATANGGTTWSDQPMSLNGEIGAGGFVDIACPTIQVCFAAAEGGGGGGTADIASNAGGKWNDYAFQNAFIGGANFTLNAIACPSTTKCYAVGSQPVANALPESVTVIGDAKSWSTQPTGQSAPGQLDGLACPAATACTAVGTWPGGATLARTTAPRLGWKLATLPNAGPGQFGVIVCPSQTTCYAIGPNSSDSLWSVVSTSDGGGSWSSRSNLPAGFQATAMSCPTSNECMAVSWEGQVAVTINSAKTWAVHSLPNQGIGWPSITCASSTHCFAFGNEMDVTSDGGATWTTTTDVPDPSEIYSMACPSPTTCFASEYSMFISTTDGGNSWVESPMPYLDTISCPSTTTCFGLTDETGSPVMRTTDGGVTWQELDLGGLPDLSDISCSSVNSCVALGPDASGTNGSFGSRAFVTNDGGSTWGVQDLPNPGPDFTFAGMGALACPGVSKCFATNGSDSAVAAQIVSYTGPAPAVDVASTQQVDGSVGSPIDDALAATGGTAPYAWSIQGPCPTGLSLDPSTGVLSGVPTEDWDGPIIVVVTDNSGASAAAQIPLSIATAAAAVIRSPTAR